MVKTEEQLQQELRAYRLCFNTPAGGEVLTDLADLCRANESCAHLTVDGLIDRDRTLLLEGRREVWLHIQTRLHLRPVQMMQLYGREFTVVTGDDDNG